MDVSVIIPAYNAERTIGECLSSLLNQDFKGKYEVIVVNDGSRDSTPEIVGKEFPKVALLSQVNGGPAKARNSGARKAKGKIIIFTDSDCVAKGNFVGEMAKPFARKGIAGVQGRYLSKQRGIVARFGQLEIEQRYEGMAKRGYIDFIGSYAAAYLKDVFWEFGGFDERFKAASGEDTDLSFRISRKHKFVFNQDAIVWHTHPESLKKYLRVKFFRGFWRILVYKKHKTKLLADSYTSQMAKFGVLCFYGVLGFSFLALIEPVSFAAALACAAGMLLATLKFGFFAARRDFIVGVASIPIQLMRTSAIGLGTIYGVLKAAAGRM